MIRHPKPQGMRAGRAGRPTTSTAAAIALAFLAPIALLVHAAPAYAQAEPLTGFAAQKVAVMPIQTLRSDSTMPVKPAQWAAIRKEFDDSVGAAIAARGIGKTWTYAPDIARMAKRNTGYTSDPFALGVTGIRGRPLKVDDPIPAILVNNLRSLIALGDARYALVPVELSFVRKGTELRPVVRLVMIDGRMGRISWFGDMVGAPVAGPVGEAPATFASADVGAFAQKVADLIAPR